MQVGDAAAPQAASISPGGAGHARKCGMQSEAFPFGMPEGTGEHKKAQDKRDKITSQRQGPLRAACTGLAATPSCAHVSQPGGVTAITSNTPAARSDQTALVGGHFKKKCVIFGWQSSK